MAQPTYVLDAVFASDALLRTLTEQYGTPLLVYDRETWLARVESLRHAFAWAPRFRQFFPVKAAANPALLRMLLEAGCGLLCGPYFVQKRRGSRQADRCRSEIRYRGADRQITSADFLLP